MSFSWPLLVSFLWVVVVFFFVFFSWFCIWDLKSEDNSDTSNIWFSFFINIFFFCDVLMATCLTME
jgi:hypothetical protein